MEAAYIFKKDYFGFNSEGVIVDLKANTLLQIVSYGALAEIIEPNLTDNLDYFASLDDIQKFINAGIIAKVEPKYRLKQPYFFYWNNAMLSVNAKTELCLSCDWLRLHNPIPNEEEVMICHVGDIKKLIDLGCIEEYYEETSDDN